MPAIESFEDDETDPSSHSHPTLPGTMPQLPLRGSKLSLTVSFIGAMAFVLQGYDQAVVNGLLELGTWESQFPSINTTANKSNKASVLQGTAVALYEVGCAVGALSCFFLGDLLGRRRVIFAAACTVIVGVILQATPFSLGQLVTGRVVTGVGVGAFTATVPMWVTECTKAHHRGKLVMLQGWLAISGVCLATWIDFGFFYVTKSSVNWRFPIAFQAIFAFIVLAVILFLPGKNARPNVAGAAAAAAAPLPRMAECASPAFTKTPSPC